MAVIEILALLAVVQYLFFGTQVSRVRGETGIKAPTMTGDAKLERMIRVHLNTLEILIAFFPALYVATQHASAWLVAPLAAIYLIGRQVYWRAYLRDPSARTTGFLLSIGPIGILILLGLGGSLWSMIG